MPEPMEAQPHITLFNDERYQRCNIRPGQRLFRHDHAVNGRLIGTFSGVVSDGLLDCGYSAPFGGIDIVKPEESAAAIVDLLRAVRCRAPADGVHTIRVRSRPGYFGGNESVAEFAIRNLDSVVESCEISLGIEVRRFRSPELYAASLDGPARNKLRQGLRAGCAFSVAETTHEWSSSYDLLVETRARRGVQLKISLSYIMRLREIFGPRIAMYRLRDGDALAAAALVYRVRPDWDYVVAWGDNLAYRPTRVMNALAYHLVETAIARRVSVMDLGISSVGGVADEGLISFKRNVGASTGLRIDFRLPLTATPSPSVDQGFRE